MPESKLSTRPRGLRIKRLALKELRETLRDRRTIITLIAMPLLVYPILSLILRTFLFSTLMGGVADEPSKYNYVIETDLTDQQLNALIKSISDATEPLLAKTDTDTASDLDEGLEGATSAEQVSRQNIPLLEHNWGRNVDDSGDDIPLEEVIRDAQGHVGLRIKTTSQPGWVPGFEFEIITNDDLAGSKAAAQLLSERINLFNRLTLQQRLESLDVSTQVPIEVEETSVVSTSAPKQPVSFAAIIPLMLVLMTITGAVYPAIDLTAGERERGTLETLVAAPIPRIGILVSKFIAVLTVAILTATLNIAGILVTVWAFRLDDMLGADGLTFPMIANVFALLVLFAGFFSAVLLAVTSYARSFKEAQAYLIPIILLSLAPGLMALTPGLSLNGPLAVVPMVNILILARDVLQSQVETIPALVAVASTVLYGFLAILLAAKIFGTDAILYGSHGSWKDLFTRPQEPQSEVSLTTATACLALLFPANFVLIGVLGRVEGSPLIRFLLMGQFTFLTFLAFPFVVAVFQRIRLVSGFALELPKLRFWLVAVVLGCSLWPLVMSIITEWHNVLEIFVGEAEAQARRDRLIEYGNAQAAGLRNINPFVIAMVFAVIPAICEEWFFRGFLLRSLLKNRAAWLAILISAVVFGLFHVLSNSVVAMDRFLPTTLVGLVLGWLCYRSGSMLPGILLHMFHNGIVTFLAYYQPKLSEFEWFPDVGAPIPTTWVLVSLLISVIGIGILQFAGGDRRSPEEIKLGSFSENP